MRLPDDIDPSMIDWASQADLARSDAEGLPQGARRNAEIDRALACEALAHSRALLLQREPVA